MTKIATIEKILFAVLLAATSHFAFASVQLASTELIFSASGSPNTIAGSWSAPALDILNGEIVEYYSLDVVQAESPFGLPSALSFYGKSGQLSFGISCPVINSCVGYPNTGDITILNAAAAAQNQQPAANFLLSLDPDSPFYTARGAASVFFNSGGNQTTATGLIRITAFGETAPQQVPEPESLVLVLIGLLSIFANTKQLKALRS